MAQRLIEERVTPRTWNTFRMQRQLTILKNKEKIRNVELEELKIGGDTSFAFMSENENKTHPVVALEIPYVFDNFYPQLLKDYWGASDFFEILKKAGSFNCDLISVKFNIQEENLESFINESESIIKKIEKIVKKPLIFRGANNTQIDKILLPQIAKYSSKPHIIAFADEFNYEQIVPSVVENNHILVLRSPIDINLAKELNILTTDKGLRPERILIDPDMGGLGYGLEYGYSIVERIKQAGFDGDTMLNMPIIAFIGEESYKAKEAKSDKFDENWGDYAKRATMWEISAASAIIAAGANLVVLWNPESIVPLKECLRVNYLKRG